MQVRGMPLLVSLSFACFAADPSPLSTLQAEAREPAPAEAEVDISYFDSIEWSTVYSCVAKDSFLYVGMHYGVLVLDIRNPSAPQPVASIPLKGPVLSVVVRGNYVYAACSFEGLHIIDISNPLAPMVVHHEDTPGIARELAAADSFLYLADDFAGLRILDISEPHSPTFVDSLTLPLLKRVRGLDIQGSYVLLAASQTVHMVDVSDPAHPLLAGEYPSSDVAWDVAAEGDYAFVANGTAAMPILSIGNPDSLTEVSHGATTGYARRIVAAGGYAYVADETGGLKIFDVTNPLAPVAAGVGSAYAVDVSLFGNLAFTAGEHLGATLFDISDPNAPVVLGTYESHGALSLEIAGDYLFVVDAQDELSIFDLSNPRRPAVLGRYTGQGWYGLPDWETVHIDADGEIAAIAPTVGVLDLVDITDPAHPVHAGDWFPGGDSWMIEGLDVVGDTVYVADPWSLGALDISDPSSPQVVGSGSAVNFCCVEDLEVHVGYAYIAGGTEGLRIMDVSGPDPYMIIGYASTPGSAIALDVEWPVAYVLDDQAGLLMYGIGLPDSPALLGTQPLPWPAKSIRVAGRFAYLTHPDSGLLVVDVHEPSQPELAGQFRSIGQALDVAVQGNVAYLADRYALTILDVSEKSSARPESEWLPEHVRILKTFPNPFNATVTVSYTIDRPGRVGLSVYNVLGLRVRTLLDQTVDAGTHSVVWNGRCDNSAEAGTGVYFFRLQLEGQTAVRKVLLLK